MNIRVLLVDSHEDARQSLVRRLESDSRVAVTAQVSTVAEAGAAIQEASFDLTLMNVRSHNGGAVNLCREWRELTTLPLVVLTSFMTTDHWRSLREAGAADYLLKHADSRLLCDAIIRLADRYQADEAG
jgi:DNA-binding NarL/FixJ family response regulator